MKFFCPSGLNFLKERLDYIILVEEGPGPKRNWPWRKKGEQKDSRDWRSQGTGLETLSFSIPLKPYPLPLRFFIATCTLLFLLPVPNNSNMAPSEPTLSLGVMQINFLGTQRISFTTIGR